MWKNKKLEEEQEMAEQETRGKENRKKQETGVKEQEPRGKIMKIGNKQEMGGEQETRGRTARKPEGKQETREREGNLRE